MEKYIKIDELEKFANKLLELYNEDRKKLGSCCTNGYAMYQTGKLDAYNSVFIELNKLDSELGKKIIEGIYKGY